MKRECKDHLGNHYKSVRDMCRFYNITPNTYYNRIALGWKLEDILNPTDFSNKSTCCDHLGHQYSSFNQMCENYNLSNGVVRERLNRGCTLKDALTAPLHKILNPSTVQDHNGNIFNNLVDMCSHYNISYDLYRKRRNGGMSIAEALETPIIRGKRIVDHNGNQFNSVKSMCDYYEISTSLYKERMKRWKDKEKALTTVVDKGNNTTGQYICKDHLGCEYSSQTAMCDHYRITVSCYKTRLRHGWTQREALTSEPIHNGTICYDHLGIEYPSKEALCKSFHITRGAFGRRIALGWSIEEALTIPKHMYIGEYRVAECLNRLNVKFYHDCSIKDIFLDLGISVDWNDFLSELQTKLGSAGYNWSKQKIQRLRPDFVLYTDEDNKICGVIEFDGEQHQNFVEFFFKTIEEFYRRSDTDFVKQSFWEYMNIPMLRIRHDQIDMIDDMVQDFIDNPQDYIHNHNTYLSEDEYWSILTEQKQQIELAFAA